MKLRKTISVNWKVETPPGFKATRKYRLAFALSVLPGPDKNSPRGSGLAVAFEKISGFVHLITFGNYLTKKEIQANPDRYRGQKFICVGQKADGLKFEPIFEMIIENLIWKWED